MKVLQIHDPYVHAGGEDTIADTEAELLREAGHEPVRFRLGNPEHRRSATAALLAAPWNPAQYRAMRQRARRLRPDIAHVHNTWFALSPSIFRALALEGVPTVMTLQNFRLMCVEPMLFRDGRMCTDCVGSHPWHGVRHSCYRSRPVSGVAALTIALNRRLGSWDHVARFFAPSEFVKQVFVDGGFDPARIVVKPNVVGDPGPRPEPPSRSRTVVYVARIAPEKGPDLLLDAWRDAAAQLPELELVLIGDGPLRARLERDPPPRTRFVGWVEPAELPRHLLAARALVYPTQWTENFGRPTIEAMAAGLPVLASDIATPAEVVGELGPDWLVDPRDRGAWADALRRLADDQAIDAAGRRSRQLFEQKYNLGLGLQRLIDTYEEVRAAHAASTAAG